MSFIKLFIAFVVVLLSAVTIHSLWVPGENSVEIKRRNREYGDQDTQQKDSVSKKKETSTSWTGVSERSGVTKKIGAGVVKALSTEGKVFVVIALRRPHAPLTDLPALKQEIAGLRESVLSELSPAEFRQVQKYEIIPSLSGWVLNEKGLAKLATHPHVVRIDLDVGGGGGRH